MKPHIKVIQRNGVDIFVTSSMQMKPVKRNNNAITSSQLTGLNSAYNCMLQNAVHSAWLMGGKAGGRL